MPTIAAARQSQGRPGGDTHIWRCSSGASFALAHGGTGGVGEVAGVKNGVTGENIVNLGDDMIAASNTAGVAARGEAIGQGGDGGTEANFDNGAAGTSGQDGTGFGAGGGGQGKTDLQIDGNDPRRLHGGKGADGIARFTRVG
jgi:hypothetical protein